MEKGRRFQTFNIHNSINIYNPRRINLAIVDKAHWNERDTYVVFGHVHCTLIYFKRKDKQTKLIINMQRSAWEKSRSKTSNAFRWKVLLPLTIQSQSSRRPIAIHFHSIKLTAIHINTHSNKKLSHADTILFACHTHVYANHTHTGAIG